MMAEVENLMSNLTSYFERKASEVAANIGAKVHFEHDLEFLVANFSVGGTFGFCTIDRGRGFARAPGTDFIDRSLNGVADRLYAVTHTEIPRGAVWMMLGSIEVQGEPPFAQPITRIDRRARTYGRVGDVEPRPWPPVVFYAIGRKGYIETI